MSDPTQPPPSAPPWPAQPSPPGYAPPQQAYEPPHPPPAPGDGPYPPPPGDGSYPPPPPGDGPYSSAPPEPAKKKNQLRGIIILVVVAAVLFGAARYFNRDKVQNAEVGDCMRLDDSDDESPFHIVECDDPAAGFKVLKVISDPKEECKDIAGASQSSTSNNRTVCMGEKNVDPATAVNVAKEGDCLVLNGNDAKRADCSSAEAQDKVLKRITNVSEITVDQACADVEGATAYYSWSWKSIGAVSAPDLTVDVLLCLGPK